MKDGFSTTVSSESVDDTARLAELIAPVLVAGDTILLQGKIGAGKSHFARALIKARLAAANIFEDVPSPTYTLVQTYDDGITEIWHSDLYRLSDTNELVELGLEHAFENAICLVEWPDRLGSLQPTDRLDIELKAKGETERTFIFRPHGLSWTTRIDQMFSDEEFTTSFS